MPVLLTDETTQKLRQLAEEAHAQKGWWLFPSEPLVKGFMGLGRFFVVGDQPSTDPWPVEHPHRRAYYDLLADEGVGDAHLTDLYKKRGQAGELKNGLPTDFQEHLEFFLKEVDILQPTTILAMGKDAYNLLRQHTPKLYKRCFRVWHFGTVRRGKLEEFQTSLRNGIKIAKTREKAGLKPG